MGNTKYIAFSGETLWPNMLELSILEHLAHSRAVTVRVNNDDPAHMGRVGVIGHVLTDSIGGGTRVLELLDRALTVGRVWFTDVDMPIAFRAFRNDPTSGLWEVEDVTDLGRPRRLCVKLALA